MKPHCITMCRWRKDDLEMFCLTPVSLCPVPAGSNGVCRDSFMTPLLATDGGPEQPLYTRNGNFCESLHFIKLQSRQNETLISQIFYIKKYIWNQAHYRSVYLILHHKLNTHIICRKFCFQTVHWFRRLILNALCSDIMKHWA